jgi:hypothetical protein
MVSKEIREVAIELTSCFDGSAEEKGKTVEISSLIKNMQLEECKIRRGMPKEMKTFVNF